MLNFICITVNVNNLNIEVLHNNKTAFILLLVFNESYWIFNFFLLTR